MQVFNNHKTLIYILRVQIEAESNQNHENEALPLHEADSKTANSNIYYRPWKRGASHNLTLSRESNIRRERDPERT